MVGVTGSRFQLGGEGAGLNGSGVGEPDEGGRSHLLNVAF
jgi:hypothetical protein